MIPDKTRGFLGGMAGFLSGSRWNQATVLAWAVATAGILLRVLMNPGRQAVFGSYLIAGDQWMHGLPLYLGPWGGFIYSPLIAAFLSPFTLVPEPVANLAWRILSITALLASLGYVLTKGPFRSVLPGNRVFVFLAMLPFSIGNLDRGQANPLLLALLLLSISAAHNAHWTLAVAAVVIATYLKIYPLAIGLLFCVISPRRVPWKLAVFVIVFGLLPFALQNPHYVAAEYRSWFGTRLADNRFAYPINNAPLDLWFLLVRLGKLSFSETAYRAVEILGGATVAVACNLMQRHKWDRTRLMAGLFILATIWIILLGPSTESATYLLLAPLASIGLVQAFTLPCGTSMRALISIAFALLSAGILRGHLMAHTKNMYILAAQPLGAIVFLAYAIQWLRNERMWKPA